VDSFHLIPIWSISDFQNLDVKSLSLSEMIDSSVPWSAMICHRNVYAKSIAFEASMYGNMWTYLVNQSMITNMLSYSTLVIGSFNDGSLVMKSIAMDC
jgi:hypothetical protein